MQAACLLSQDAPIINHFRCSFTINVHHPFILKLTARKQLNVYLINRLRLEADKSNQSITRPVSSSLAAEADGIQRMSEGSIVACSLRLKMNWRIQSLSLLALTSTMLHVNQPTNRTKSTQSSTSVAPSALRLNKPKM